MSATSKLTRILDLTVFSGLLGLAVLTVVSYGSVDPWWEAVFECAVFALTAVWIVEATSVANAEASTHA
jgi:hypothetical protein